MYPRGNNKIKGNGVSTQGYPHMPVNAQGLPKAETAPRVAISAPALHRGGTDPSLFIFHLLSKLSYQEKSPLFGSTCFI